jgi:soluble epoxide hydrolase/lipid-phosphate phosphatase
MYGSEEETAMRFYPTGKLEASLKADYMAPYPSWMTPEYKETRDRIFASGGYRGPTNWYRVRFGQKLGIQEEIDDKVDPLIHCRTLWVEQSHKSMVTLPSLSKRMTDHAEDCISKQVSTTGHWVQFEATDEINKMLEEFLESTLQ